MTINEKRLNRRELITQALALGGLVATSSVLGASASTSPKKLSDFIKAGKRLGEPDKNGLRLYPGFTSRIVARSGQQVTANSDYLWHAAPDGGHCFPQKDGGWIYVSNSEMSKSRGGVGAIQFAANGDIVDARSILSGTNRNCAGGATPWGAWLSCEENGDFSAVYECDPTGQKAARKLPALGSFNHEAVAYDLKNHKLYMTEDRSDGCLYRYVPTKKDLDGFASLDEGRLEVAQITKSDEGKDIVRWNFINDPSALLKPTRYQTKQVTTFDGGEGIVYDDSLGNGTIVFATKGDNRVWSLDLGTSEITIVYDYKTAKKPILKGVDNLTIDGTGNIIVAEDYGSISNMFDNGSHMQVIQLNRQGEVFPIAQIVGHGGSEVTGPAFSPDYKRLYFSSQRGTRMKSEAGITFEVSGPFI